VSNGTGPKSLPQFEDRFLYHLVDLAGDLPMGHLDGVSQIDLGARLADELRVSHDFIKGDEYLASPVHETILGTVRDLEDEGLLTVPIEETGPWELRPTRSGRQRVAQWHEKWKQQKSKRDRENQWLILLELESQWRRSRDVQAKITTRRRTILR
jgi:DNA-binding PadR family transcriptional regulator